MAELAEMAKVAEVCVLAVAVAVSVGSNWPPGPAAMASGRARWRAAGNGEHGQRDRHRHRVRRRRVARPRLQIADVGGLAWPPHRGVPGIEVSLSPSVCPEHDDCPVGDAYVASDELVWTLRSLLTDCAPALIENLHRR